ncbi:hypothetical protein GOZ80_18685 [Agrobacterium vitis]|uniref:Uncharacterized protein n=1 Tax=Agrobacterium vitis TaxID=373 RepID=A0A109CXE2_AGRVI|nr:hypothetical protein [Agrobacterium vitis]KAA3506222.1 hypothetical protein DXM22_24440 [Agrobacterium vitis]KAA3520651.1 hypothetical protein DXT89_25435 [Agrobacterium vitis]MBF2712972.1 hypothetical protein [Agrobacterium vitis]MCF1480163.1 hypothetical protein [Agrobacterium vitis]MUO98016.1 hypothetical protein [Agrobacterium vitis]
MTFINDNPQGGFSDTRSDRWLIQILLPQRDDAGTPFEANVYEQVRQRLTQEFGGMTFYRHAPAEGTWQASSNTEHDEIVLAEIMAADLDEDWWSAYKSELEKRFHQSEIVVRAIPIKRL